jgi:hypothetical protein
LTWVEYVAQAHPLPRSHGTCCDVRAFAAGAKQSDDITVFAVRFAPGNS